jgi:hypothetical protein
LAAIDREVRWLPIDCEEDRTLVQSTISKVLAMSAGHSTPTCAYMARHATRDDGATA